MTAVMMMYKILIIEDDMGIAEAIQLQARMRNLDAEYVHNFRNVIEEFISVKESAAIWGIP